jgi:hypothetical protein
VGDLWSALIAALALLGGGDSASARCDVGGRPEYFVPGGDAVLLGCARLGVSGKRVEFSTNRARIDGKSELCINPAYGRGRFIPSLCKIDPSRFAVRDAGQPRGYRHVIWGTAPRETSRVTAGYTRAAIFRSARFAVFVVELPLAAASGPVTVTAEGSPHDRARHLLIPAEEEDAGVGLEAVAGVVAQRR